MRRDKHARPESRPSRAHTKHEVSFFSSISNAPGSEEWWSEVRPKGVAPDRRDLPCKLRTEQRNRCNVSQVVRNIRDKCSLLTVDPSVLGRQAPQKRSFDRRSRDVRVATRRSEEKFTAAHVTSVEARAVTLSPGTRKPLVVLQAVLLTANTSASAVE